MDSTSKKSKKKLVILLAVVAVIVIAAAAAVFMYNDGIGAVDSKSDEAVTVDIPSGSGAMQIIDILDENGLIKNKTMAKIHVKLSGYDSLQANTYIFTKDMDLKEIMTAINTGDFNYLSKNLLTIVEGSTVPQAATAISEKLNISSDELIALWNDRDYLDSLIEKYWFLTDEILQDGIMYPLEGYLYPETYTVTDQNITAEGITEQILDYTDSILSERKDDIEAFGMTVHEFLSLTSVVESESLFEEDRPKIAGVFMNRLEEGMPLQSDITVLYALQEKRVNVTYDDLEVDSPYNTYKYTGLPVGPVCSVSAPVMDDTLAYEKSDYLYFFAKEDGTVIYSKTLEEHDKAVSENLWY
ncbi:MAG TPA: endolytic transglycosylase MltG [Candidatus Avanaerovorax faecigallinarum]|nr:endolytic transglycosylase MltG [Candidatus Avanaerovorax faecigallinarum]